MTQANDLTLALGGEWRGQSGNAPCPVCQPERRPDQRGLSIRSEGGQLLAHCHKTGCDFRDIVKAAGLPPDALRIDPEEARKADAQREADATEQLGKARKLWANSAPICGTKGETYLRGRGITCPLPQSLRWAVDTYHGPSGRWLSAMVADVSTGGVHRTFFDKAGCPPSQIERGRDMTLTGAELRRLRRAVGLTQAALAARAGVHRETVGYWEAKAGPLPCRWGTVRRFLDVMGIDPAPYNPRRQ